MNSKSIEALKYDRRMANRRNWIQKSELDAVLENLPDATDKIAPPEEEDAPVDATAEADAPAPEGYAPAAPTSEEPPTGGGTLGGFGS